MKRNAVPKIWPIPRKGTKFVIKAGTRELPIVVAMRDMLKIAKNRKEVKKAIHEKKLLISGRVVKDDKAVMCLFDVLTIIPSKQNYSLRLSEKGKFKLEEISEKDSKQKVSKVSGKKKLKGKKTQLNLLDGRNILEEKTCSVNDSVVLDLSKKKIVKILSLKEKANALIIEGKHAGERGIIEKIKPELKMVELVSKDKKTNVLIKQLMVLE